MFNLEQAVSDWRREMAAAGIANPDILDELESHLRDSIEEQLKSGVSAQPALETAIRRMGTPTLLKSEFKKTKKTRDAQLCKHPVRVLGIFAGILVSLTTIGCLVILPLAVRANAQYAAWLGNSNPSVNFTFVCRFVLGLCLGLALPIGMVALAKTGLVNHRRLARFRPCVMVANLVIGAWLTTPEVVTQIIMFVALQSLCELAMLIAGIAERRAQRHA